jgi:DNA polymerase elongation subunit (family B)
MVAGDTDGLAFCKADESKWTPEDRAALLAELNAEMEEMIRWEDDGVFKKQLVIKTKNYVLQDEKGNVKIKGSALKATSKEKALQEFLREVIDLILAGKKEHIFFSYIRVAKEIERLVDVTRWASKKTITKAVLNGEDTQQVNIRNSLNGRHVQEGDKIWVFYKPDGTLAMVEDFNGEYSTEKLHKKLYDTLSIFGTVLDVDLFANFTLKRNQELLKGGS